MNSIHNNHGSVIVFVTLMIVLLLIMVGIGLDTGQLTYTRSQGQAAVDAAALAAVSGLPARPNPRNEVDQRVAAFNANNHYVKISSNPIGPGNITYVRYNEWAGTITNLPGIANANGVRVALESNNPYTKDSPGTAITAPVFLAPLLNLLGQSAPATVDVNVSAVAVLRTLPSVPIVIKQGLCNGSNTVMNARLRERGASTTNSCWTTYTESAQISQQAQKVQALFTASASCSGLPANTGPIEKDTKIELINTTQSGPYLEAKNLFSANDWLSQCWIVAVVPSNATCSGQEAIVDWAKICPIEVQVTPGAAGSPRYIAANVTCSQDLYRAEDNLCFSPRLLRDAKSGM